MGNWGKALDAATEETVSATIVMSPSDGATAQ
jgi:hypothetical protein